ncbi:hypothetical protein SAMN04488128_10232 [Chitinophaga eiseniae]|uniref:Uncharacterized protein n=1 Tax=Chitinophaga eiseniae TaxID=634771 RepID=A0A1T4PWJ9_9BACT|nr:hypothetical protein [Chitinophaga eiseniae]SJZ95687.1 hypothetical protein SAMN04488128_10232 [Chitinophaga eiseniae]
MSIHLFLRPLVVFSVLLALPFLSCKKQNSTLSTEQPDKLISRVTAGSLPVSVHSIDGFIDITWFGGEPPFKVKVVTPLGTDIFETFDNAYSTMKPLKQGDAVSVKVTDFQNVSGSASTTNFVGSSGNEPIPGMNIHTISNDQNTTVQITWVNDPNSSGPFCSGNLVFNGSVKNGAGYAAVEETASCSAQSQTLVLPKIWNNDTIYVSVNTRSFPGGCDDKGIGYYFIIPGTFYDAQVYLQAPYCNYRQIYP